MMGSYGGTGKYFSRTPEGAIQYGAIEEGAQAGRGGYDLIVEIELPSDVVASLPTDNGFDNEMGIPGGNELLPGEVRIPESQYNLIVDGAPMAYAPILPGSGGTAIIGPRFPVGTTLTQGVVAVRAEEDSDSGGPSSGPAQGEGGPPVVCPDPVDAFGCQYRLY
jgi:hypothetical protein